MNESIGLFEVNRIEAEQTAAERERSGWRIFRLPFRISSREDFFEGIRNTFPLDPELQSDRSWDALSDSLWGGLEASADKKILVVWPNAKHMKKRAPEDFAIATNILSDLPTSLANPETTAGRTKQLLVLQVI